MFTSKLAAYHGGDGHGRREGEGEQKREARDSPKGEKTVIKKRGGEQKDKKVNRRRALSGGGKEIEEGMARKLK